MHIQPVNILQPHACEILGFGPRVDIARQSLFLTNEEGCCLTDQICEATCYHGVRQCQCRCRGARGQRHQANSHRLRGYGGIGKDDLHAADQRPPARPERPPVRHQPGPSRVERAFRVQHRHPRFRELQGGHEAVQPGAQRRHFDQSEPVCYQGRPDRRPPREARRAGGWQEADPEHPGRYP